MACALLTASNAWAQQFCWTGSAQVDCTHPQAYFCVDMSYTNWDSEFCMEKGYVHMEEDGLYCVNSSCDQLPAQVPELEEYAAALFLVLALFMGWKVRSGRMSAV